jgi:hypothetical protein
MSLVMIRRGYDVPDPYQLKYSPDYRERYPARLSERSTVRSSTGTSVMSVWSTHLVTLNNLGKKVNCFEKKASISVLFRGFMGDTEVHSSHSFRQHCSKWFGMTVNTEDVPSVPVLDSVVLGRDCGHLTQNYRFLEL